ncbi:hypothetical protein [Pseudomonas fluvialis]|uniref:hypothetical protein n=1 Tax=Pseudomonas fluvialis TaxID=1793966 RepID=UPI0035B35768
MRKLILGVGNRSQTIGPIIFRLRDGLRPQFTGETIAYPLGGSVYPPYAVSPDGQKAVASNGSSSTGNFVYSTASPTEESILPAWDTTTAAFNGQVYAVATSDLHFAVGGLSPFLYIFDWATKTLQTINNTGLGAVKSIAFNGDGTKMVVHHATSPYLRIYNTADWTFVNAASPAGSPGSQGVQNGIYITAGDRIVIGSSSSPYITVFNMSGARLSAITSSTTNNSVCVLIKHPDENALIWVGDANNPAFKHIGLFNLDTYACTNPYIDPQKPIRTAAYDAANRELILCHDALDSRYCSLLSIDYPSVLKSPGAELDGLVRTTSFTVFLTLERNSAKITGTVRDIDNNPAQRRVLAIHRAGEYVAAATMSNATTGDYELIVENTSLHDVQFRTADGELLNDLFFARVEPEAI